MTNPLRLCYLNHADRSIITAGASTISSLPPSHLKDDDIQAIWRSGGSEDDELIIDLGQQLEVALVALININIDLDDTVQVRVSTSDPTGEDGSAYDSGVDPALVDPAFAKFVHILPAPVIGRYVRIDMSVSSPPIEAGRLVVGPVWSPSRDMSFGWEKLSRDSSVIAESLGGNPYIDIKSRRRGWRFRIFPLTEEEAEEQVDELNRLRGIGQDILVCRNKDSINLGRDTLWGLLEAPVEQRRAEGGYEIVMTVWDRV